MGYDTHLMALMSSLHGAILFFCGCFFGFRMGRKVGPEVAARPAQEVQP